MSTTSARQEYEVALQPLPGLSLHRELPLAQRLWQQAWIRKGDPAVAGGDLGSGGALHRQ